MSCNRRNSNCGYKGTAVRKHDIYIAIQVGLHIEALCVSLAGNSGQEKLPNGSRVEVLMAP